MSYDENKLAGILVEIERRLEALERKFAVETLDNRIAEMFDARHLFFDDRALFIKQLVGLLKSQQEGDK